MDARSDDVSSIDSLILALYDAVSFKPRSQPDWNRFRTLFHPDARLVPPRAKRENPSRPLNVDAFIEKVSTNFVSEDVTRRGFSSFELARRTNAFGRLAQVFSIYESRFDGGSAPLARGIYSLQLVHEQNRWWVLTILWENENSLQPIPDEYLYGGQSAPDA